MPKKLTIPRKVVGSEPDRVKGEDDWEDVVKKAIKKKKPPEGWPRGDDGDDEKDVMDDGT